MIYVWIFLLIFAVLTVLAFPAIVRRHKAKNVDSTAEAEEGKFGDSR